MVEKLEGAGKGTGQERVAGRGHNSRKRRFSLVWWGAGAVLLATAAGAWAEVRTSYLQSAYFSRVASGLTYDLAAGPSNDILFPKGGPDDKRRGYSEMPRYLEALKG